ncbi:tetratricopeptide repeat protein [Granulicella sp. WH15]|nr:tetratricopeptide repeat protein [Granulicella sp. WH15]
MGPHIIENVLKLLRPRLAVFASLLLCAVLCASSLAQAQTGDVKEPTGRVVLVLPFDNRSGQPNLNWIADSFPDTLNQRLSSAGFLTITRDDRLFALDHLGFPADFRPTRATTIRIAQTLDADFVVVGNFNVQNGRILVQAQVLEVNKLKLSPALDDSSELARLFDIENAVAWKIARQIDPQFAVAQQTFLSASQGVRLDAFENYIRGVGETAPAQRIKFLSAAVAESPTYSAALLALGRQQFADRQYDQAASTLAKIPQTDRLALEAGFFRGLARFNEAKYAEAEAAFSFVATRLPLPEVVNNQGVAAARQGRDGSALFQRAVNADPNDADFHYNLAVSSYRRGDFAAAHREIDATLKLKPSDGEAVALKNLIDAGRRAGSSNGVEPTERIRRTYSEASFRQAAFQLDQVRSLRLATLPPASQAAEYSQLGRDYMNQGLLPEAEQEFQTAIKADPTGPLGHAGLAQVREQSGNPEAARSEAEQSLQLKPNAAAYLVLARIDLQANKLSDAADNVSKALHLEPTNPGAQGMRQALQARGQSVP